LAAVMSLTCLSDHVIDRAAEVGIVDHMSLGTADIGGKARLMRPDARQMQPCRIIKATAASICDGSRASSCQSICMKRPEKTSGLRCGRRPQVERAGARLPYGKAAPDGSSSKASISRSEQAPDNWPKQQQPD